MMMEDSYMLIELVFSDFVLYEDNTNPDAEYVLDIYTNKTPKTEVQLVQSCNKVETYKKNKQWSFIMDVKYFFQIKQPIVLSLLCNDGSQADFQAIGNGLLTLGHFLCLPNQRQIVEFDFQENMVAAITIQSKRMTNLLRTGQLNMSWRAGKIANVDSMFDFWKKNDSYLKFMKIRGDGTYVDVAKTEVKLNQLSPKWNPITISLKNLIDEKYKPISFKIECWHKGDDEEKQIGQIFVHLEELKKEKLPMEFFLQSANVKKPGNLILEEYEMITFPTLVDYLQEGLRLKLMLGIDFTDANKNPLAWESLHYVGKDGKNPSSYQKIVQEIWNVIEEYNCKYAIEGYGFGGKPHFEDMDEDTINNCIPLTGDANLYEVEGLDGFNQTYVNAIKRIEQQNQRKLFPFLKNMYTKIEKSEKEKEEEEQGNKWSYHIIVAIIAGDVEDHQDILKFLIENTATVPASVYVVNIDKSQEEKKPFALNIKSNFEEKKRNILRYFDYNFFQRQATNLVQQMLKYAPPEIVEYMMMNNRYPQFLNSKDIDTIKRISSS